MTAETRNPETAIATWEPRTTDLVGRYSPRDYNLLIPTVQIRQINPYLVPDIEVVQLSADESKGDIYHDSQMKQGHYAPTAKGLARLRQVAGIDEISSERTDDGRDPDVVEWTVVIEMALPSGQRVRAHGTKRMDLGAMHFASDNHRRNAKKFLLEHSQTKALNRAIRSILSLHGSMPKAELAKPWAVLRWVPDMSNPEVRSRMLDNLLPAVSRAFGPDPKQVGTGEVIEAAQAPEEDVAEADYRDEPDAKGDSSTPAWFDASADQQRAEPELVTDLRERRRVAAETHGGVLSGASAGQRTQLREKLGPVGIEAVSAVLWAAVELGQLPAINDAEAEAVLGAIEADADYVTTWRAAADVLAAVEAAG